MKRNQLPGSQFPGSTVCGIDRAIGRRGAAHPWLKTVLGVSCLSAVLTATPAHSAERIYISYGLLERSVSVESLERFANEGEIEDDLRAYAEYVTEDNLEELKTLLNSRPATDIDAVAIAQFLYTPQGEFILGELGEIIQTEARRPGLYAIRAALILAADDDETGLTPLNVLRKFPGYGIRVNAQRSIQMVNQLEQLINETNLAIAAIEQQSAIEAATELTANLQSLDLRSPGAYTPQRQTITLKDRNRNRDPYETDIYLPQSATGTVRALAPMIVISHGLGGDRSTYAYLARHLASYGFAVAVPEHPGSNAEQLEALIEGRASEVTQINEFIDRPLDITFLLDHLEYRSRIDPRFQGRINLQQVGVVGQSLGGYTALALAGAEINIPQLLNSCPPSDPFNISLLLQCRALDSPQNGISLRDERVKAIVAINPIGSSLLGETGYNAVRIPAMIVTGNADTIAPALPEQVQPFTWLGTDNKYLLLMRRSTHFSTLGEPAPDSTVVDLPDEILGPDRTVAQRYLRAMSTAFFNTYVAEDLSYRSYLRATYARSISLPTLPLRLVRFLTPDQLAQSPVEVEVTD